MRVALADGRTFDIRPLGLGPADHGLAAALDRLATEPMGLEEFRREAAEFVATVVRRSSPRSDPEKIRRAADLSVLGKVLAALRGEGSD